jgi:hypothetical protein
MTFLNAALLAGAAALAIPIIIHLFHKSRFTIVNWGAMHLLESVIRTNRRRMRIEQLILLLIRCLIPALLAVAMARPVWKGVQTLIGNVPTSTVVALDNSYSMEAGRAGVSNFTLAKNETIRLVNDLKRGSEVGVVLMGEGGRPLFEAPTYDAARVTQAIEKTGAGFGAANIPQALDDAAELLSRMREPSRQLVVLTDFQHVSFPASERELLKEKLTRLRQRSVSPMVTFFDVGNEVKDNVAIEGLEFSKLIVGVGQKIHLRALLRNYGSAAYPDLRVMCKTDGKEKAASQIALGPNEKGQVLFTHAFDTPGSHVIEVAVEADTLKADNVFLASIPIRDKVPVLLVNGDPASEPLKGETDFAEIALQPFGAAKVELADLIQTRVIKTDELDSAKLNAAAVTVVANIRRLSDAQLSALEDYVRSGGGLLLFPGSRVDAAWWNSHLHKNGEGLLPTLLGPLAGEANSGGAASSIISQRFENAALELFNDPRNGTLADSAVRVWFKLDEESARAARPPATVLARLETGDPFFVEKPFGEGRVIACATAIDADWSNLPVRAFYLPLLQRLCVYLASTIYPPRNLDVGQQLMAFVDAASAGKKAALTLPDGRTIELPIEKKGPRAAVEFSATQQPGVYALQPPGGAVVHYVVNASRRESDLQKLSSAEIAEFAREQQVGLVRNAAEFRALDQTRRFGREIWKPLLWSLLGLMFVEMVVQQRFARGRGRGAELSTRPQPEKMVA